MIALSQCQFFRLVAMSGGILWNEALRPLSEIHWVVDIIFLFYIFSTVSWCKHLTTVCFVKQRRCS